MTGAGLTRHAVAILALWAIAAACTPTERRWASDPCVGDGPCGEGGQCIGGYCAQPCQSTQDCQSGVCLKQHCAAPTYACSHGLCDDGNACSVDFCNSQSGACRVELLAGACDDGDPCSVGDECADVGDGPQCRAAAKCDDGDPTTSESCNPATGQCTTGL